MSDEKHELIKAFPTELEEDAIRVLSMINQTDKLDFSACFVVNIR